MSMPPDVNQSVTESHFKSWSLQLYLLALYETPAVEFAQAFYLSREEAVVAPGPAEMPALVIWKQFDCQMPQVPPAQAPCAGRVGDSSDRVYTFICCFFSHISLSGTRGCR